MNNWPTANGYLDDAAVILNGQVIKSGHREECEVYASSQNDDQEYDYAWRSGNKWVHRRSFINGEAV